MDAERSDTLRSDGMSASAAAAPDEDHLELQDCCWIQPLQHAAVSTDDGGVPPPLSQPINSDGFRDHWIAQTADADAVNSSPPPHPRESSGSRVAQDGAVPPRAESASKLAVGPAAVAAAAAGAEPMELTPRAAVGSGGSATAHDTEAVAPEAASEDVPRAIISSQQAEAQSACSSAPTSLSEKQKGKRPMGAVHGADGAVASPPPAVVTVPPDAVAERPSAVAVAARSPPAVDSSSPADAAAAASSGSSAAPPAPFIDSATSKLEAGDVLLGHPYSRGKPQNDDFGLGWSAHPAPV